MLNLLMAQPSKGVASKLLINLRSSVPEKPKKGRTSIPTGVEISDHFVIGAAAKA